MSAFPFTIKRPYGRHEESIIHPSGIPKRLMPSTVFHSVCYLLPINIDNTSDRASFIEALRRAFPGDKGLGLIMKEASGQYIFELALRSNEDRDSALNKPIYFQSGMWTHSNYAILTVHPSLELFKVDIFKLPLQGFDTLKTILLATLSERGTILDIVLYKESFWFTGNGYIVISRKKHEYDPERDPSHISLGFSYPEETQLIWSKIE